MPLSFSVDTADADHLRALLQQAGGKPVMRFVPPPSPMTARVAVNQLVAVRFRIDRRTSWILEFDGALIEAVLDEGEVGVGERNQPLFLLEMQQLSGEPQVAYELALRWLAEIPLGLNPVGLAALGYGDAQGVTMTPQRAGAVQLDPDMDAGTAWNEMMKSALNQVIANAQGFLMRPEEHEYLHQLRVGLRRLTATLALSSGLELEQPGWLDELKSFMRALNAARDLDVLAHEKLPQVQAMLHLFFAGESLSPEIIARLSRTRLEARKLALHSLRSTDFTRLLLMIGKDLSCAPVTGVSACAWAARCLDERWRKLNKRGRKFDQLGSAQKHRLRAAAKQMRYAADAMAPLFEYAKPFISKLASLQNGLGAWQDCVVVTERMRELSANQPELRFDAGLAAGVLVGGLVEGATHLRQTWNDLVTAEPFWAQ